MVNKLKIAFDDGDGTVFKELNNIDEFEDELHFYSAIFLVENGTEEELEAVCQWASEIIEDSVLVTDSVIDSRLKDPLKFIEEIRKDWDYDMTDSKEFQVNLISDIVDLYS